jgi:hypothetical protein
MKKGMEEVREEDRKKYFPLNFNWLRLLAVKSGVKLSK